MIFSVYSHKYKGEICNAVFSCRGLIKRKNEKILTCVIFVTITRNDILLFHYTLSKDGCRISVNVTLNNLIFIANNAL